MEKNELQSRFSCLLQERGADARSEGMGHVIREHFLMENEELKDQNEVRFHCQWYSVITVLGRFTC